MLAERDRFNDDVVDSAPQKIHVDAHCFEVGAKRT